MTCLHCEKHARYTSTGLCGMHYWRARNGKDMEAPRFLRDNCTDGTCLDCEELTILIERRMTRRQIAAVLGIKPESLRRRLQRHKHPLRHSIRQPNEFEIREHAS